MRRLHRVPELAWWWYPILFVTGLAAGFVATLVGNIFYLTMIFSAFYVILLLIIAAPAAFGIERVLARREAAVRATPAT